MSSIKGKTVYMIIYNYSDFDYSIVQIMEKLDDAYEYICSHEANICNDFKLIQVENTTQLQEKFVDEYLNICYITSGQYNKFNLCNYDQVSSYAIISMKIN